jgi:hypothetical protein
MSSEEEDQWSPAPNPYAIAAAMNELGIDVFEAAAMFWGGGYDAAAEVLSEGPFVVAISQAVDASQRLHMAIYRAARAVDASRRLA